MTRSRDLIKVGYWREPGLVASLVSSLPRAADFVDPAWDASPERPVVLAYLKQGRVHEQWMGWSGCRLCGKENGTKCLTDGVYVWPEGLAHYVEEHSLRPDQSLVAHILEHEPIPPAYRDHKIICAQWMLDQMIAQGCDPHCHVCSTAYSVGTELGWTRAPAELVHKDSVGPLANMFVSCYGCRGKPWADRPTKKQVKAWRAIRERGSRPQGGVMRRPARTGASFLTLEDVLKRTT